MSIEARLSKAEYWQKNWIGSSIFTSVGAFFELKSLYETRNLDSFEYLTVGVFLLAFMLLLLTTLKVFKLKKQLEIHNKELLEITRNLPLSRRAMDSHSLAPKQ